MKPGKNEPTQCPLCDYVVVSGGHRGNRMLAHHIWEHLEKHSFDVRICPCCAFCHFQGEFAQHFNDFWTEILPALHARLLGIHPEVKP